MIAFVGSVSMPATKEAAQVFEKKTGIHVELHFGGSGSMLSQVILSRRGDLYFPGSPGYMAKAIERKAVNPDSVREIAYLIPDSSHQRTVLKPQIYQRARTPRKGGNEASHRKSLLSKAIPFVWASAYIDTRGTSIFRLTPGNSKKPLFAGRRSRASPLSLE